MFKLRFAVGPLLPRPPSADLQHQVGSRLKPPTQVVLTSSHLPAHFAACREDVAAAAAAGQAPDAEAALVAVSAMNPKTTGALPAASACAALVARVCEHCAAYVCACNPQCSALLLLLCCLAHQATYKPIAISLQLNKTVPLPHRGDA